MKEDCGQAMEGHAGGCNFACQAVGSPARLLAGLAVGKVVSWGMRFRKASPAEE